MALLKNRRKRSVALIAAAGLTVAGTGVAFAYWTGTGNGRGTAATGQSVAFVVTTQAAVGPPLVPGGGAQTVTFTVQNPGTATLKMDTVTVNVANTDGSFWLVPPSHPHLGCFATDYVVSSPSISAGNLLAGGASMTFVTTISMVNTGANQDGCKGAAVPLYITAA